MIPVFSIGKHHRYSAYAQRYFPSLLLLLPFSLNSSSDYSPEGGRPQDTPTFTPASRLPGTSVGSSQKGAWRSGCVLGRALGSGSTCFVLPPLTLSKQSFTSEFSPAEISGSYSQIGVHKTAARGINGITYLE